MLGAFPFPERDWEQAARAVEARLADAVRGSTDAQLLAAPLPSEPGEPSTFSAMTTPLTNSGVRTQSLADMARRSIEQKQSAERQMARESLALAAQRRPSIEQAALLREAVSTAPAAAAPAAAGAPRASLPAPAAVRKRSPWPLLALAAGGLALAAAVLSWLRQPAPERLVAGASALEASQPKPERPDPITPATSNTADRGASALAAPAPVALDPSALSKEDVAQLPEPKHAKTPAVGSVPSAAASAPAAIPSPEKVVLVDDPASPAPAPAEKPDQALPPDPALRPAESTGGSLPVKPSSGAVQAALGAVLGGARRCVAGDEAASSAVVVFGSDGHVTNVTVSGPAAGTPAAACIQAQLSRARVQPFAAASFSINATVRPD
jgi:hypothetical protein